MSTALRGGRERARGSIVTREEMVDWTIRQMVELFEFERDEVKLDTLLVEDLGLDSIDAIDMVVRLQELSGRRVGEDAMKDVRTVNDLVALVESHLAEGQ